jgi:hypothetical protein
MRPALGSRAEIANHRGNGRARFFVLQVRRSAGADLGPGATDTECDITTKTVIEHVLSRLRDIGITRIVPVVVVAASVWVLGACSMATSIQRDALDYNAGVANYNDQMLI